MNDSVSLVCCLIEILKRYEWCIVKSFVQKEFDKVNFCGNWKYGKVGYFIRLWNLKRRKVWNGNESLCLIVKINVLIIKKEGIGGWKVSLRY